LKHLTAILIIGIIFCSCKHSHTTNEVEAAMQKYNSLIQAMDADGISKMFTPDGKLGDVAQGRDSIKKFLSSFVNSKVLSQRSNTKSIELKADSATQKGMYFQDAVINGKDTLHLKGNYTINWKWLDGEGWKIKKVTTEAIQ
jgi:ketosteroid isomerase-like protein